MAAVHNKNGTKACIDNGSKAYIIYMHQNNGAKLANPKSSVSSGVFIMCVSKCCMKSSQTYQVSHHLYIK